MSQAMVEALTNGSLPTIAVGSKDDFFNYHNPIPNPYFLILTIELMIDDNMKNNNKIEEWLRRRNDISKIGFIPFGFNDKEQIVFKVCDNRYGLEREYYLKIKTDESNILTSVIIEERL